MKNLLRCFIFGAVCLVGALHASPDAEAHAIRLKQDFKHLLLVRGITEDMRRQSLLLLISEARVFCFHETADEMISEVCNDKQLIDMVRRMFFGTATVSTQ